MKDSLEATAQIHLDGYQIELICQELHCGIERAREKGDKFRAESLQIISNALQIEKQKFHKMWEQKLLHNEKSTKMGS